MINKVMAANIRVCELYIHGIMSGGESQKMAKKIVVKLLAIRDLPVAVKMMS